MVKYFVLGLFFFIITILICAFNIILLKKKIFYEYLDQKKKISNFDYLMDFDGNWLFKDLELNKLENRTNPNLIKKLNQIHFLKKTLIIIFLLFLLFFNINEDFKNSLKWIVCYKLNLPDYFDLTK